MAENATTDHSATQQLTADQLTERVVTTRKASPEQMGVAKPDVVIPPMPERTPKALRQAIAEHAPELLPDFDQHWKWAIADAYDVGPLPAFMARWWCEYALARDPKLDAHVTALHHRAAYECTDINEAKALLDEVAKIRHKARETEPGQ